MILESEWCSIQSVWIIYESSFCCDAWLLCLHSRHTIHNTRYTLLQICNVNKSRCTYIIMSYCSWLLCLPLGVRLLCYVATIIDNIRFLQTLELHSECSRFGIFKFDNQTRCALHLLHYSKNWNILLLELKGNNKNKRLGHFIFIMPLYVFQRSITSWHRQNNVQQKSRANSSRGYLLNYCSRCVRHLTSKTTPLPRCCCARLSKIWRQTRPGGSGRKFREPCRNLRNGRRITITTASSATST